MKNIIRIVLLIPLLFSCETFYRVFPPPSNLYVPRNTPIEKEYIHDTIRITNNSGVMESAIAGIKPNKQLVFTSVGQSYVFKSGETLEIISDGIDFSYTTFDIETNEENGEITLKLVDKEFTEIYLENKCQTIKRTGITEIPKIKIDKNLNPEQVVCTPLFDNQCNQIGYEIRYGARERGCRDESMEVFEKYQCCRDKIPPFEGCNGKQKPSKKNIDCSLCRKLGLPCPCK